MRLDIGWLDLFSGMKYCLKPGNRSKAVIKAQKAWNSAEELLITLSVRSSFDLLLRALKLPAGSEVLMSALTVGDMVEIVKAHGLQPVPVDTDQYGNITVDNLKSCITSKSRIFVFAHLYGATHDIDELIQISRSHGLFVVEDCAQSFSKIGVSGHPESDAALYSFGPIKTATALGGSVACVASEDLRHEMSRVISEDPVQTRIAF